MKRKCSVGWTALLCALSAALSIGVFLLCDRFGWLRISQQQALVQKLCELDNVVRGSYIGTLDEAALADAIATGYVQALDDPYAYYWDAQGTAEEQRHKRGENVGIGISVTEHPQSGNMYILQIYAGGPAEAAGLQKGDEIVSVQGQAITDIGYAASYRALRGQEGETREIDVLRGGERLSFTLTLRLHESQSVFLQMLETTAYIQITDFNESTPAQFEAVVTDAMERGATGLLFDLRRNGGGAVDAVATVLDFLLPQGDIISAEFKDGKRTVLHRSDEAQIDLPMAVLVDEKTASAAELFAVAIRDFKKGKLIGAKTYGKGVMQRTYLLSDGSSIKLTVANYFGPAGENYDGVGLEPDISIGLTQQEKESFYLTPLREDRAVQAGLDALNQ